MRPGVVFTLAVAVALLTAVSCADAAGKGLLSIKCGGTSGETRFIADQRGTEIRDGMRVVTANGGFIVFRIPIGNCTPERFYYSIGSASYPLEFSPDGKNWSPMVTTKTADG